MTARRKRRPSTLQIATKLNRLYQLGLNKDGIKEFARIIALDDMTEFRKFCFGTDEKWLAEKDNTFH